MVSDAWTACAIATEMNSNCNFGMATVVNYSRLFFVARCLCVRGIAMCVTGELHIKGLMVGFNRAWGFASSRARRFYGRVRPCRSSARRQTNPAFAVFSF